MAGTWLYVRDGDLIEVRRWDSDVGGRLVVIDKGRRTEQAFDSVSDVLDAQRRLETILGKSGWSLQDFYPDRRTGFQRRAAVRATDRRRARAVGR